MMTVHLQNKQRVWDVWQSVNHNPSQAAAQLNGIFADRVEYHGFYPMRNLSGREALLEQLWLPLFRAFPDLMRRSYMLIGGDFEGENWVVSCGELIGTFVHDWLGIAASGTSVKFRYGEFCRMAAGVIEEIRLLVDLPDLIRQADRPIMPPNPGRDIWVPGPLAGDGLRLTPRDPDESAKTIAMVESMVFDGLNLYDQKDQDSQGLERFWNPEMVWHGPVGVGSTYGLDEFKRNAQGPIVGAFPDRKGAGHRARVADGMYAATTGWPSLVGTHQHDFRGWAPTHEKIGWNIMDFYRRDGDLLRENWVLIDLIDAGRQSGVNLYEPLTAP